MDFLKKNEDWLYALPILNMVVLHVGQTPLEAGFPFFMVTAFTLPIILFVLHFTQYPSVIMNLLQRSDISGIL